MPTNLRKLADEIATRFDDRGLFELLTTLIERMEQAEKDAAEAPSRADWLAENTVRTDRGFMHGVEPVEVVLANPRLAEQVRVCLLEGI